MGVVMDADRTRALRPLAMTGVITVVLGLAVLAGLPVAAAQPAPTSPTGPGGTTTTTTPNLGPVLFSDEGDTNVASLSEELAAVPVDGSHLEAAERARAETATALYTAQATKERADARIAELEAEVTRLTGVVVAETQRRTKAAATEREARDELRDLAVARYVHATDTDLGAVILNDLDRGTEAAAERFLLNQIGTGRLRAYRAAAADHRTAISTLEAARFASEEAHADLDAEIAVRDQAAADAERLAAALGERRIDAERARAVAVVAGTDLPVVALDAYWRAAQALRQERPECGVPWWALAGVGRVEGDHGRFGPLLIEPDGETNGPIIGIRLDGTRGTRVILDTDGGLLDGDIEYDRAVGPMQFIPSTWARHARDGNGDGRIDPHNLYDAARTAAQYLCAGGPMNDEGQLLAGFLRYNRSQRYAERVLALAHGYQTAVQGLPGTAAEPAQPAPPAPPAAPAPPVTPPG
jgi:membrane-bound lytic murein transglycosylase B